MLTRSAFAAAAILSSIAHADQVGTEWLENGIDAGSTVGTAQGAYGSGSLTAIKGLIDSGTDADIFRIYISTPTTFSATTVGTGTTADTQLFLFTTAGLGIACNDDSAGGSRSTLPAGNALYASLPAGEYLLAISRFNFDPVSVGGLIFPDTPTTSVFGPTGPGGASALSGWTGGTGLTASSYNIALAGAVFLVPVPPAATAGLSGLACILGFTALRRRRSAR
jgi:hypothetical protein